MQGVWICWVQNLTSLWDRDDLSLKWTAKEVVRLKLSVVAFLNLSERKYRVLERWKSYCTRGKALQKGSRTMRAARSAPIWTSLCSECLKVFYSFNRACCVNPKTTSSVRLRELHWVPCAVCLGEWWEICAEKFYGSCVDPVTAGLMLNWSDVLPMGPCSSLIGCFLTAPGVPSYQRIRQAVFHTFFE